MILHGNFFKIMWQWKKIKFKIFIYSVIELELKITCTCHQAKIAICCQKPLVAPIASKLCTGGFLNMLNPNLPSDLLSDHSSNTSFNPIMGKKLINCTKERLKCRLEQSSMYDNTYKILQQTPTYKNVERWSEDECSASWLRINKNPVVNAQIKSCTNFGVEVSSF